MKKLTIEFIKGEFEKEGYTLVSTEYINCFKKLDFICPKEHKHSITWAAWSQGQRCARCARDRQRLNIKFVREQFEKEGYTLISKEYKNAYTKLKYVCPKKHEGTIRWGDFKHGLRCKQCSIEAVTGENSPNWKPELTDEDRQDRRLIPGYNEWTYSVKERDNFTCQVCGQVGGGLVSHHLNGYKANPKQRTTLKNGVCLCENCHNNFHHQYGKQSNTEEQFLEFKENN